MMFSFRPNRPSTPLPFSIANAFRQIDTNRDGVLTNRELNRADRRRGPGMVTKEYRPMDQFIDAVRALNENIGRPSTLNVIRTAAAIDGNARELTPDEAKKYAAPEAYDLGDSPIRSKNPHDMIAMLIKLLLKQDV